MHLDILEMLVESEGHCTLRTIANKFPTASNDTIIQAITLWWEYEADRKKKDATASLEVIG